VEPQNWTEMRNNLPMAMRSVQTQVLRLLIAIANSKLPTADYRPQTADGVEPLLLSPPSVWLANSVMWRFIYLFMPFMIIHLIVGGNRSIYAQL